MSGTRRVAATLLAAGVLVLSPWEKGPAGRGVIEFSDEAPPPTDKQKELARAWSQRVAVLSRELDSLGNAMRATYKLRQTVAVSGATTTWANREKLRGLLSKWENRTRGLFSSSGKPVPAPEPGTYRGDAPGPQIMWTFHQDRVAGQVGATLALAGEFVSLEAGSESLDRKGLILRIDKVLAELGEWFDEMLAEHGILNRALRYYPYATQPQTAVSCPFLNSMSRDFKCVETQASGSLADKEWVFGKVNLEEFCVAEGLQPYLASESTKLNVRVRRTLVGQPAPKRPLVKSRVATPRSSTALAARCS